MERLTVVRGGSGGSGGELALFVRLHVLEAVCAYHKGDITTATTCFDKAELVQGKLHIDKHQLTQFLLMGFSESEARLGLRACQGDSTSAVDYITQRRQEKKERREKEEKERKQKRLERKLGKTASGECILDESPGSCSEEEEDPDVKEAVNELVPYLATEDEESHLNLSLEEETSIIAEYRTLLLSAGFNTSSATTKS